jgi:CubicO group peptidase (beta-lactamase class C family)
MQRKFGLILVITVAAAVSFLSAATASVWTGRAAGIEASVDGLIRPLAEKDMIGGAVLIAKGEKFILEKAFGFADRGSLVPNTVQTPFRLASVSKSLTAVAVMQLVEKGKLSLDSRLESFLPGFPNGDRITIEHLLGHRSGIPSDVYLKGFAEKSIQGISLNEAVDWIRKEAQPRFEPGTRFDYSNSGYLLLTAVVEKVTGRPFERYLAENLFSVAGMKSSGLDSLANASPLRAKGYSRNDKGEVVDCPYRDPSFGWGCGALYSTVGDLFRFNRALVDGRLLSEGSRRMMWTARSDTTWNNRYGFGWFIQDLDGSSSIVALGSTGGYVATLRYFPEEDVVVAVLLNHDFMLYSELFEEISRIALGKSWTPLFGEAPESVRSGFSAYAGTYKMADGALLELRLRKGGLEFGDKSTGAYFRVDMISEGSGYVAAQNALLRFRKAENGDVELVALYGNLAWSGRRISASRIKP